MITSQTLSGKTLLITGGTSALGSELVSQSLAQGARVFFTYFQASEKAKNLIQKGAEGFLLDLANTAAMDQFAKEFKSKTDKLDSLIHNAAAVRDHTLANLTEEDWDYVMSVNLKAPYYLTKKLLSFFLKKNKQGQVQEGESARLPARQGPVPKKIFFITSRVGLMGGFGVSNYAASKAGLIALTKSLSQELGSRKVLVNAVNPGFMKSNMTELLPEEVKEANRLASPLEQFSNPKEVAEFILYLCSDQMRQVTGQLFHFESRKIH